MVAKENPVALEYYVCGIAGLVFFCIEIATSFQIAYLLDVGDYGVWLSVVFFAMLAAFLFFLSEANDLFSNQWACLVLVVSSLVSGLGFFICIHLLPWIGAILGALNIGCLLILGLSFLDSISTSTRSFIIAALAILAGIFMVYSSSIAAESLTWTLLVCVLASTLCFWLIGKRIFVKTEIVKKAESKKRVKDVVSTSNFYALFSLGICAGMLAYHSVGFGSGVIALVVGDVGAVGCGVAFAGLLSILFLKQLEHVYCAAMKKYIGPIIIVIILAFLFIPEGTKWIMPYLVGAVTMVYLVILIIAMTETVHFEQLSPIWLYGREVSYYCAGVCLGTLCVGLALANPEWDTLILCLLVILISCFQIPIFSNNQYPFIEEPVAADGVNIAQSGTTESAEERWPMVVDALSTEFSLSPRQKEVFTLLAKGRDIKYIANEFVVSTSTVKSHIHMLYKKLGVHSQQELISLVDARVRGDESDEEKSQSIVFLI